MLASASAPNLPPDEVPESPSAETQYSSFLPSSPIPENRIANANTPSKQRRKSSSLPSSLPPELPSTKSKPSGLTPKGLTPTQARRHKLQATVLREMEKKKAEQGDTFGYYNSRFRGLGGNVSLFSKEYKKHLGLDGKTLQAKDLEEQAANNSLTDPFASDEAKEEDEFFAEFDEESIELKEAAHRGIVAMQKAMAAISVTGVTASNKKKDQKPHFIGKVKNHVGALSDSYDEEDTTIPRDDTFKFTSSFNKIALKKLSSERDVKNEGPSLPNKILGAANKYKSIFDAKQDDPNMNKNASFSMKEFDRLCRNFSDHADSPQKSYLVKSSELFLVPQPILVSHLWGVETDIDLTGRGFYSDYVAAFAETLKNGLRPGVHTIRMGSNRMDDEAAFNLFDAIVSGNCQLEVLVLKDNEIGNKSMPKFSDFLKLGHLMELDLSNNDIQGQGIETLCKGIANQATLHTLNISQNPVGESGVLALASLVDSTNGTSCSIISLGLAWTELSGMPGAAFFRAVGKNTKLKTLDVSFNVLGGASVHSDCVVALGDMFAKNRTLEHLDLSYNHLNSRDTVMLGMALKKNHFLFGLHYEGNEGWVDSRGFLRRNRTNIKNNKLEMGKHCAILEPKRLEYVNKECWICNKWVEEKFEFDVAANGGDEDQSPSEGVFLGLSIDTPAFTPIKMKLVKEGKWIVKRMLPPGVVEYVYIFSQGGKVVRKHCVLQPTLARLKGAVSTVGKVNPFANLIRGRKTGVASAGGALFGTSVDNKEGHNSLGMAFNLGSRYKKNEKGQMLASMGKSSKSLWQRRMEKAQVNLSNRERAHLKEIAKNTLYEDGDVGEEVDFELWKARMMKEIKLGLETRKKELAELSSTAGVPTSKDRAESIDSIGSIPEAPPDSRSPTKTQSPSKKRKKVRSKSPKSTKGKKTAAKGGKGKGKGKGKAEGAVKKEKDGKDEKKGGVNAKGGGEEVTVVLEEPEEKKSSAEKRSLLANPDAVFGPEDLWSGEGVEKNNIFKLAVTDFDCQEALPRLLRPYSKEDGFGGVDDEDGLWKKGEGWNIEKSSWVHRCDMTESKDYYDCDRKNGRGNRVHKRACAADLINADLKKLFVKLKIEDGEECLNVIKENFILINDVFKAYSTKVDVPHVLTLNTFTEFALDCEIIDHAQCSLNAVDTIYIHANLKVKKPTMAEKAFGTVLIKNTKHLMARYQFIIALVRIAYAKNGGTGHQRGPLSDALKVLFEHHIEPYGQRIIGDPYRERFVYKEQMDKVLVEKEADIRKLYEKWSHTRIPMMFIPKNCLHKGMTLQEYLDMLDYADVLDQTLSVREAKISYAGSLLMMENVVITPHLSMSIFDFKEALVRAAHIIYDSLGDDYGNGVIPMLRGIDDMDDPDEEVLDAISDILRAFIEDLAVVKKKVASGGNSKGGSKEGSANQSRAESREAGTVQGGSLEGTVSPPGLGAQVITEEGLEEAIEMNVRKGSMDEADEEEVIQFKVRGNHGHKPKMLRVNSHNHGLGVHKEGRPMLGEIRGQKSMRTLGQLHHHHESSRSFDSELIDLQGHEDKEKEEKKGKVNKAQREGLKAKKMLRRQSTLRSGSGLGSGGTTPKGGGRKISSISSSSRNLFDGLIGDD